MSLAKIKKYLLWCFFTSVLFLSACDNKDKTEPVITMPDIPWWQTETPDVVIGDDEFYAGNCSITRVNTETNKSELIFKRSSNGFKSCKNRANALTYDGEYIILDVCEITFGAGGCGRDRYRSKDFVNWQEDIGITWIKGEQYEAWRNLGSTSSKADAVKKIVSD